MLFLARIRAAVMRKSRIKRDLPLLFRACPPSALWEHDRTVLRPPTGGIMKTTQTALPIAEARPLTLAALTGNDFDDRHDFDGMFAQALLSQIPDMNSVTVGVLSSLIGPGSMQAPFMVAGGMPLLGLHAGRNMALPDPESAYRMMTLINSKDVLYKAQYSELSQLGSAVASMQEAGAKLGGISTASGNDAIEASLQSFVGQYNDWIQRFNPDMQSGGLLAGTQAAQISRYELEQSVKNIFNGANDGVHGLGDLGIGVDPVSQTLTLDCAKLDAMLASGKQGVVDTLQEFGANFAKSAGLLNADSNFIPRQLDNLDRAIHYIDDNGASLRAEFGTGDTAKPTGQVAQALAAYRQSYGG
jgi:hypothetical protein